MKFHEYVTSKLHTITQLQNAGRHREAAIVKKFSPIDFLRRKTTKLIAAYRGAVQNVFGQFDPVTHAADIRKISSADYLEASAGIRHAITTLTELDWFEDNRPFYNVYPIVEKLVTNTKLDLPVSMLKFPSRAICFRFPRGHEPLGLKTALIKINNFDTPPAKAFAELFVTPKNPNGDVKLFMSGSFEVVDDSDRFMIHIPDSIFSVIGGEKITVEQVLVTSLSEWGRHDEINSYFSDVPVDKISEDLPMYTKRLYFLFRLSVLAALLADGNDLITPAVLASDQEKYDAETNEAAKQWLEERAAKIQGRGFDFGKGLQNKSEISPHWRNPHMALYWTGEGRTKPVLKLRAGSVVIPKTLSQVPMGYDCPVKEAEEKLESDEHVYFLREPAFGYVKIGRTKRSVEDRRRESNTFVPGGLTLLGYIVTGDCTELETRLHREYAHRRKENEFFELAADEVRTIIEQFGGVFQPEAN